MQMRLGRVYTDALLFVGIWKNICELAIHLKTSKNIRLLDSRDSSAYTTYASMLWSHPLLYEME